MELLEAVDAAEKTIVILSDGEIVMNGDAATAESSRQFQSAVEDAQTKGVRIHVIGLGADMADDDNTIFSAAAQTKGINYHAPQATDIQNVIDSILLEQLGVKKTRAAIVDTDGSIEDITVTIPSANTSRTRILLTSESPIQNLKADFSAVNGWQYSGSRYTLLELDHPTDNTVHITFQGRADGQVKIDVISEYVLTAKLSAVYTDSEPETPGAEHYDRSADISAVFYDAGDSNRQMLTDPIFQGLLVPTTADGDSMSCYLRGGAITFQRTVKTDTKLPLQFDFTKLDKLMTINDDNVAQLSDAKEDIMRLWIEGVYIGASYVAAGFRAACQCPDYLHDHYRRKKYDSELPGVRYDVESGDHALWTRTTMPKEITGFTNTIKDQINRRNFGWVFASESAALEGQNITDITIYKARNLLYDPERATYEPAYKTQVTTYIERILRHATGDFKEDRIKMFFSNNPASQKSQWVAKQECINAVLDEGDDLGYSIDETTGMCDLTIYFDGNARNLEVMINRLSSKKS